MKPEVRLAVLEWAQRQAAGENEGLRWVDSRILSSGVPFTLTRDRDSVSFRHFAFGKYLPPPMVSAAQEAQEEGVPTALEGMLLLFARVTWLIKARQHYWTPHGPVPALLASLVEAYGVSSDIHLDDRERLARLVAHLPTWFPERGSPKKAQELLDLATADPLEVDLQPTGHLEAFACRSTDWHRRHETPPSPLKIEHGLTWCDHEDEMPRLAEDIVVGWVPNSEFPTGLLRLLPIWSSLRLVHTDAPKAES